MQKATLMERLFGTVDISYAVSILAFALIGVAISLLIHSTNRDKKKSDTPKFSFKILIKDNWKRILLNVLLILVTIRFCKQITGLQLNEFIALLIGISFDKLSEFLQNKKIGIGKNDSKKSI